MANLYVNKTGILKTGLGLVFLCLLALGFIFTQVGLRAYAQESSKEEESLFVAKKAFQDGFYEVSLGLLERFLKNYPASVKAGEVNLLIGECYFHQNKFLDALAKFETTLNDGQLSKDIKDVLLYWIGEVHFRGNNFSRAASYYKKIIDEFPGSSYVPTANYSLGWCLFQERQYAEALAYFKTVEDKFPKEAQAQDSAFKIIECLYNLKDYKGLKEKLNQYLAVYSKDTAKLAYLYFYLAESDYYLNNFKEAIEEYSKVLQKTDDERMKGLSQLGIGWAYLKLKQYKEAEDTLAAIIFDNLEKKSQDVLLLGKAILYFETKRFNEVKNIYDELINTTQDPVILVQAYLGKADTLYNIAEYKEAIKVYRQAMVKVVPEAIAQDLIDKIHYGLAWSLLKEGEFKGAIEEFQKIAKNTEDKIVKVAALCQIGDAYQDSGDHKKAQETYDGILRDYPDSFYSDYVQYQLGLIMLKTNNYDGAVIAFQNLKNNFPDSKLTDDASYALGLVYFQKEDYAASKEIFEKFQDEFKDSNLRPQAMYLLGTSLYNLAKYNEAMEAFKNITRIYGHDAELTQKAEYEIADCLYQMGNEKDAMEKFKALRVKYPDSRLTPEVIWWLGEYYYRHNDLILARRYFSSLIQDFSKSNLVPDAYYALGSTYEDEASYQEAIDNFEKVIALGESDLAGQAAIAIAGIYVKQEKLSLAIKTYKDVTNEYPNLANLIYPKIGDIYYKMSNYEEALVFYRRSLDIVPVRQMADIQFKIAEVFQAQGRAKEAVEEYLKISYLYAQNKDLNVKALLRVASIYEDEEDFKEALAIYQKIASLDAEEAKYATEKISQLKELLNKRRR